MRIIAIANQKGGVGKTTTAVTIAHALALEGNRTLLIDLDTQGNAADALGMEPRGDLYSWLIEGKPLENIGARENLDVVRSDKTTALMQMAMVNMATPDKILNQIHTDFCITHDYAVLDCAPSVNILHTAALAAADYLIIPTRLDQFAIKGVVEMLNSLAAVRSAMKWASCELAGIVPTFHDRVTNESHEQLLNLVETFKEKVWPPIPQDNLCRVANRKGMTLWEIKQGRAVVGYQNVMEKVRRLR